MGICHLELPTCQTSVTLHGFLDFQFAVLNICEGDLRILVGLDLYFLNSLIHHPVFIFKPPQLVAGFLGVVDTGTEIMPRLAIHTGNDCSNLLGTFRV